MALITAVWRHVQARLEAAREVAPSEGKALVQAAMGGGDVKWALETKDFPADKEAILEKLVGRREAGEPLQQILGFAWFYGRKWRVTPEVLIPRPDTEILVEAVLERLQEGDRMAEVGVGTGCVGGTLLAERPGVTLWGVDISAAAAEVARANLREHGVDSRAEIVVGDGMEQARGSFKLIVSNPPYVTDAEWEDLETDVRDFEPRVALTGAEPNPDGLLFYHRLAAWGVAHLEPGGWLCVETGWQQGQAVRKLLEQQSASEGDAWHEISVLKDLGGRERVVCARKRD